MFSGAKQLYKGYVAALQKIRDFTPDLAIGFGSYHSLPAMLASIRSRIPLFLHEQNIVPGKVNKLFSRFAKGVGMSLQQQGNISIAELKKSFSLSGNCLSRSFSLELLLSFVW